MKIDNIKDYHIPVSQYKPKYGLEHRENGHLYDNESVNRGYSGSSVSFGSAANIFTSRWFNKLLDACGDHTTIIQNLVALVLALGPRPIAILSTPGNNKEDKIYASGHSMASGLIGFIFSSIVMYPLGIAAKLVKDNDVKNILNKIETSKDVKYVTRRISEHLKEGEDKINIKNLLEDTKLDENFLKEFGEIEIKDGKPTGLISITKDKKFISEYYNKYAQAHLSRKPLLEGMRYVRKSFANLFADFDAKGNFKKLNKNVDMDKVSKALNMTPDVFVFGVLKAMLTVAMIPPILKYVFGIEKGKPAPAKILPTGKNASSDNNKADKTEGGKK